MFIAAEWLGRNDRFGIEYNLLKLNKLVRYLVYLIIIISLFYFSNNNQDFIYFQF